jgi:hypothetical protein
VQIADLAIQAGIRLQSGVSPITARPIRFQSGTFEAQVQSLLTNKRSYTAVLSWVKHSNSNG